MTSTLKTISAQLLSDISRKLVLLLFLGTALQGFSSKILIPMDDSQRDHLKAYGVAFWTLERDVPVEWLLNYRGGSFLIDRYEAIEKELQIRGVTMQIIADVQAQQILSEIADPEVNMEAVKLEKAPKIAVYAPEGFQPWDDAVTLVMEYAEIPYERIYDRQIIEGLLPTFDWLHLHHEGLYRSVRQVLQDVPQRRLVPGDGEGL